MDERGALLAPLDIITTGLPEAQPGELIGFIEDKVHEALELASRKREKDDDVLKETIRRAARKAAKYYTGKETGAVTTIRLTRVTQR